MAQKHQGKPNTHSNKTDEDLFPLFKENGNDELFRLLFSSLDLSDGTAKPGSAPLFNLPDVPRLLDPTNFNSKSCSTDKPSPLDAGSESNTIRIELESSSALRTNGANLPPAREPSSLTLPLQKQGASLPAGCGNSHDSGPLGREQLATVKENSTSPVTTPGMGVTHARKQSGSSDSVSGNGSGSSLGIVRTTTRSDNHAQSDPSSPLALMKPRKGASGSEQTLSPMLETSDGTGLSSDSLTSAPLDNTSTGGSLNSNTHALPHRHIRTQGDSGDGPVSLEEFTSAQRPAAEAILAYKREHPDTAIPTTYFTSALVEVKDGKGRCLVGPCALERSTTLKRVDHLYEHVRDRHFGCKPHKCDVCTQRFSREVDLKRHQRLHVRKMQACPVCSNEYSRVDNLKRHVKDKHPDYSFQSSTSRTFDLSDRDAKPGSVPLSTLPAVTGRLNPTNLNNKEHSTDKPSHSDVSPKRTPVGLGLEASHFPLRTNGADSSPAPKSSQSSPLWNRRASPPTGCGVSNILWNPTDWASFEDQSPSSNRKEEDMFPMDIASPFSFETNAILDPASMSMLDTLLQQMPSGTPSMPDPMSFSTVAHINIPPRPSGLALQLKNHQYDLSFVPTSLPDMQNQYTHGSSVGTRPGFTYSPESRRSDSAGYSLSPHLDVACQHTHLRHDSAGSLTMNYMWPGRPSTATGCSNSPMLDTGSLLTSPMFTAVGNEQLIPVDEMPATSTRPVTISGMDTFHARKQNRSPQIVSGNSPGSSLGIVHTTAGTSNRPQPYPSHNRYEQTLSPMLETGNGTGLFFDGFTSAPPENISTGGSLNAITQSLSRLRIKVQGDGGDAQVSLEEFTSAQRLAAEAILAYQREHPDTAIPTAYFTSALVEIKDGKGRCLIGSCSLEQPTKLKRIDHLYEHVRDRHFGCKPHKCDICTQRFSRENDLKRHQSVHVRDVQACPVCNNAYSRFDNLRRHVKDKHPDYNLQLLTSVGSPTPRRSQLASRLLDKSTL